MKIVLFVFGVLSCVAAFAAGDGSDIAQKLRAEYNGQFMSEIGGVVRIAPLADGRIVVETDGELAKFLLYNLPQAPDVIEDRPADRENHFMNYFVRQGTDLVCGFLSKDLRQDPLPAFKCRFVVDKNGAVSAYVDRENIPNRMMKFEDFFYSQLSVTTTSAFASSYFRTYTPGASVSLQFQGVAAQTMYGALTGVQAHESPMGPYVVNQVRDGESIWCLAFGRIDGRPADPNKDFKCQIEFSPAGQASRTYRR